jgi:hypothetical protein
MNKLITLSLLCAVFMGVSDRAQTQDVPGSLFLRGWVCDTANNPIPSVSVSVIDAKLSSMTDSAGRYAVGPLPAGNYVVLVRKEGYHVVIEEHVTVSGNTSFYKHNYRLSAGTDTARDARQIAGYGYVTGFVKEVGTKEPLPGAMIEIDSTGLCDQTDVEGYFLITRVPKGIHTVKVKMMGYKPRIFTNVVVSKNIATRLKASLEMKTTDKEIDLKSPQRMVRPDKTGSEHPLSKEEINALSGH